MIQMSRSSSNAPTTRNVVLAQSFREERIGHLVSSSQMQSSAEGSGSSSAAADPSRRRKQNRDDGLSLRIVHQEQTYILKQLSRVVGNIVPLFGLLLVAFVGVCISPQLSSFLRGTAELNSEPRDPGEDNFRYRR